MGEGTKISIWYVNAIIVLKFNLRIIIIGRIINLIAIISRIGVIRTRDVYDIK